MARPKIIHVVVAGAIGGAERMLAGLAGGSPHHCLALMTPNPGLRALFADAGLTLCDRGPVRENPAAYLWRSFGPSDIAWLGRVLEQEGGDVFHAHTFASHVLAARAGLRFGRPVLRTEHGVRHYRDPSCALFRHWALRHTTRIVAVSGFVARRVGDLAPHARGRIEVIPNGIDLARFAPLPPPGRGPFTLAAVCRLDPVKRLHLALEALAQVTDVRLDIVGEGSERGRLERLAKRLGVEDRVRFFGYLSDPRPVIAASRAVVSCTREEALGLSLIEAAAMGRPAVALGGGGIAEVVEDGRTGWLAEGDDAAALASALRQAAADPVRAARFGVAARALAEERFGIQAMCKRYDRVYEALAGARTGEAQAWPTP